LKLNVQTLSRIFITAGLLITGSLAFAQAPNSIRLAVGDPIHSSVGVAAEHFKELVETATEGRVSVEIFPDGVLFGGDQNAAVNMLQDGSLDALILSTSVYASFEPRMNAISLPYLFNDYDEFTGYLEGEPGQTLLASLDRLNTEGLALMIRTFRHITNSRGPIETPADLQGLRLRVPNNRLWVEFFGPLGANPTPMSFTEVYTALQLRTIDGQENPVEVPLANSFYEVQDYLSLTGHIADAYVLGINQTLWNRFDAETQDVLHQAALDTARFKTEYDLGEADRIIAELEERGMQVNELTPEQRSVFQEEALRLYPDFESLVGADFMAETLRFLGRE
jgi:tripartite ATP-independent transporter DctP family solute receptor